jgi:hypothetical protein
MQPTTHPDAFHFDRPVASFWEASAEPPGVDTWPLEGDSSCDVAIVGAGNAPRIHGHSQVTGWKRTGSVPRRGVPSGRSSNRNQTVIGLSTTASIVPVPTWRGARWHRRRSFKRG